MKRSGMHYSLLLKNNMEPFFCVKNMNVTRDGKVVVHDVSLGVRHGELHILLGPNGCGKSTFLNALMGHPSCAVSRGEIFLEGENIVRLSTETRAEKGLFLAPQHPPCIDGVSMLTFLHRAHRMVKKDEISITDFYATLKKRAEEFGIDPAMLKRFVNVGFSGGEKKQGEALQMLALEPKIALLDEIDSGVDVDSLKKVFSIIDRARKAGTGILLVTHLSVFKYATPDRVSIMKNGRIVQTGGTSLAHHISEHGFAGL